MSEHARPRIIGAGFDFSDQSRQILAGARDAAAERGAQAIGPEHILLSIMLADVRVIGSLVEKLGADRADIARSLDEAMPRGTARTNPGELRYTRVSGSALGASVKWAQKRKSSELDAEHLLLGVITTATEPLARVLRGHGLRVADVARELDRLGRDDPSPFRFQVDDGSDLTIYQQIVQQAKEAVATGRLRPGDRLPTVRQVAEELDIAPGTVARAYRELEQEGIVTTDRSRGTRVAERQSPHGAGAEPSYLVALLRPVAVGAYHMGLTADHLRRALEEAMRGVFEEKGSEGAPA